MVSIARSSALSDPTKALEDLYQELGNNLDAFPTKVTAHFDALFADEEVFREIPSVNINCSPESFPERSLVQFRGMVQDSGMPEVYASTIDLKEGKKLGGWGLADLVELEEDDLDFDYSKLKERSPYWVVTVPGESPWVASDSSAEGHSIVTHSPSRPHKFALNTPNIGVHVKVYDSKVPSFKPTEIVIFVGILSIESLVTSAFDAPAQPIRVPTLHVLFVRPSPPALIPVIYPMPSDSPARLRQELIKWIAEEALCGDVQAAEWVLVTLASRVHSRHPEILPLSLTITSFPPPQKSGPPSLPTLHEVLRLITPMTVHLTLPLNLTSWVSASSSDGSATPLHYAPHSENEDLHSGILQLAPRTVVTILEAGIQEGELPSKAVENLHALREVARRQSLQYKFPFSTGSGFEFPTDLPFVVMTEGRKSLFLPDADLVVPLVPPSKEAYDLYKPADQVNLPDPIKLGAFRQLVCGSIVGNIKMHESVSAYIQADFVQERAEKSTTGASITPDDPILRMNVARALALTYHEQEVTTSVWDRVKAIDTARRSRL